MYVRYIVEVFISRCFRTIFFVYDFQWVHFIISCLFCTHSLYCTLSSLDYTLRTMQRYTCRVSPRVILLTGFLILATIYYGWPIFDRNSNKSQSRFEQGDTVCCEEMALEARDGNFFLEGKQLRLISGAMHYFRVMPEYWSDRMRKMRACGLNCLET